MLCSALTYVNYFMNIYILIVVCTIYIVYHILVYIKYLYTIVDILEKSTTQPQKKKFVGARHTTAHITRASDVCVEQLLPHSCL